MPDQPGAIEMYVPQNITFDYTDATWCVIHKTAGFQTAQDCAAYFQSGSGGNNVSSHYVVGLDGTIVQCVPEARGAGANCCTTAGHASYLPTDVNLNLKTISIEHIDPTSDNSMTMPEAQKAASFKLVHDICVRHNIPMRGGDASGGIIGHRDIDPVNRARCPGNYAWDELFAYLNNGGNDMLDPNDPWVQAHFKILAPDRWHCIQTGFDIAYGNLGYYRAIQAAPRLPVGPEQKDASGRTWQPFEGGIIIYDTVSPSKPNMPNGGGNCYLEKLDSSLALQLLGGAVNTQVAALQAQVTAKNKSLAQIATEAATASK